MWPKRRPKPWPRAVAKTDHIHVGCSPAAAVSCGRNPIVAFFSIAIVPLSGETSPSRSANKVDLPAPLGPTNPIRSPRLTWSDTSSKSARPAKDFESWETVSIAESAQCPLVRCLAQLLALNFYTTPARLELGPVVSGRGGNADSSRGEFGFRAGRSAESPRVCSGGKRENPCRLSSRGGADKARSSGSDKDRPDRVA